MFGGEARHFHSIIFSDPLSGSVASSCRELLFVRLVISNGASSLEAYRRELFRILIPLISDCNFDFCGRRHSTNIIIRQPNFSMKADSILLMVNDGSVWVLRDCTWGIVKRGVSLFGRIR